MKRAVILSMLLSATTLSPLHAQGYEPSSPECLVPAGPGGGWDLACRSVAQILNQTGLVSPTVQVRNMPGAGGGVAYAYAVSEQNDNSDLITAASGGITLLLAKGEIPGVSVDDVRWIAAIGADFPVIAVRDDAPWQTLDEFIAEWTEDPRSLVLSGGSAVGGTDHIRPLQLAREAGIENLTDIRYVQFDSGQAVTELLAGRINVFTAGISEIASQYEAGNVRILAVMAPERLPGDFADIPTATELGYPIVAPNWRGFFGPGGMSDEAYDFWLASLEDVSESPDWERTRLQNGLAPLWMGGEEFEAYADEEVATFEEFARELGIIQ